MHKITFSFLLSFAITEVTYGYLGRVPIPLHLMPSATNDLFDWRMPDGSYQFGMQGQDQWRVEKRYPNGAVFVHFAYKTPDGKVHDSTITSGVPPKAIVRDNTETESENKYEKYETSFPNNEDDSTKLTARNLDSPENQSNIKEDVEDSDNALTPNSITKGDNERNSHFTEDEKILKTKKAIKSLFDSYIQKQRETEIPKSRSFNGISFIIKKPQKPTSAQVSLPSRESTTQNKYGNRKARLDTLFQKNDGIIVTPPPDTPPVFGFRHF